LNEEDGEEMSAEAAIVAKPPSPRMMNEPVLDYAKGSAERGALEASLEQLSSQSIEMPMAIGGQAVRTGTLEPSVMPHCHAHVLGHAHLAAETEIDAAVEAAARAATGWSRALPEERAAVFLKAADLLSGTYRSKLNAATMLGQSKTVYQAEIDSAAELIDFWRFNVAYMRQIHAEQPISPDGVSNTVDYRPLEGFVYAITPFNFTAIAGNLPSAPALMGNTVVWKPAATAKLSAHLIMEILTKAGLPPGVINLVYGDGARVTQRILQREDLAGVHFTGSTEVFSGIWREVGTHIKTYRAYPRLVGETGGKNFIIGHPSSELAPLATAILRGAFEYQGQKCSAASRVFIPQSLWSSLRERLCDEAATIRIGDVRDFSNFMSAVIDERAWNRSTIAIEQARKGEGAHLLSGGKTDRSNGYFVHPTLLQTDDLNSRYLRDEFFAPIVTFFIFPDEHYDTILEEIDQGGRYGLTGAVFATDRAVISRTLSRLRNAAGNIYVNDKPTGAVVGQQPFGGGRASGTNDKAGSLWNLIRWSSPRTIKENFRPPTDYRYPSME
jgi:1-pyrroline-5-carboxylate dehydrogenase